MFLKNNFGLFDDHITRKKFQKYNKLTACAHMTFFMIVKLMKRKNSAYRLQYREKMQKNKFLVRIMNI